MADENKFFSLDYDDIPGTPVLTPPIVDPPQVPPDAVPPVQGTPAADATPQVDVEPKPMKPAISMAGKFGQALKTLDGFKDLEIPENAKIEDVLGALASHWENVTTASTRQVEEVRNKYKQYEEEFKLLDINRKDVLAELTPIKELSLIPVEVSTDLDEDTASKNRQYLIQQYNILVRGLSPEESNVLYNQYTLSGKDLEIANRIKGHFFTTYKTAIQNIVTKDAADKQALADKAIADAANTKKEVEQYLNSGSLKGLKITPGVKEILLDAIYNETPISYQIKGPNGESIERTGTKAQQFFETFDSDLELQLLLMSQWLKGDLTKPAVTQSRQIQLNKEIADVLNSNIDAKDVQNFFEI